MAKLVLIVVIVMLFQYPCWCQTPANNSTGELRMLLQKSKPDSTRLKLLYQLGGYYIAKPHGKKEDLDSAFLFIRQELRLSEELHKNTGYGKNGSLLMLGDIYFANSQIAEGTACYIQVINYYKDHNKPEKEAETWASLANNIPYTDVNDLKKRDIFYKNAINLFQQLKNSGEEIQTTCYFAANLIQSGRRDSAKKECLQMVQKFQSSSVKQLDNVYYVLSNLNRYDGNLNMSLYYCLKCIDWVRKTNDTNNTHLFYGELAQVYQELGQTENSIEWYRKTLQLREKMSLPQEFLFRTEGFVVQGLIKLKRPEEALNEILSLEKRHPPDNNFIKAIVAQIKAYCYEAMKKYDLAEKNYLVMIGFVSFYVKNDGQEISDIARYDIGKFYVGQKNYGKASYYLKGIASLGHTTSYKRDVHYLLFEIDSAKGNYISAIDHYKQYKTLSDSIFNVAKSKQIAELQIKYETTQKENDINALKKDGLIQRGKVREANSVRNFMLAGVVILILFVGLLYHNYRIKQRNNVQLNKLVKEKDNLLDEKEWLVKEIHHRVKNNLQIVMGLLQRQSAYIDNEVAFAAIQNSENRMHSIALIHQKLYQSESLDLINMQEYIDELITYLKDSCDTGNRILFEKNLDEIYLDVAQAVPLGLILNEGITNAIKYAYPDDQAGIIRVVLAQTEDDQNLLMIEDQGPGLPSYFNIEQIDSLGMNLMKGLSKQLGGTFQLESNHGLTIKIVFKTDKYISAIRNSNSMERGDHV